VVFGLDEKAAIRYASSAQQLLETDIECHTSGTPVDIAGAGRRRA
jgi:hypothetical protein